MQERVQFTNRNGQQLAGILHRPDAGPVRAAALFAHCFTCTKNILAAVHIADALADEGFLVLRFDFTGLGESEGDFADTHFSANVADLLDATEWMSGSHRAPDLLVGHSLGGTAMLAAACDIDSAVAVATIGSPSDAEHVLHLLDDDLDAIEARGEARVKLAGRPFNIRREFVEDVRAQSVREGIRGLRKALLVMHAPSDELVSIDEAASIYQAALHPKSFVSLDDADHLLTRKRDSVYAATVLAAWASRFLPDLDAATGPETQPGAVVVEGAATDGFRVSVNANGHLLTGDEPESYGGTNLGPSPYDLLSASLGTCTVMTLNFYARREGLPLDGATVTVRHDRIHAEDCAGCESSQGKVDRLTREIRLDGDLDEATRARLLKIADRCPVHKTLHNEIRVENTLL